MTDPEKIGTVSILEVKRSHRRSYVNLPGEVVTTYEIAPGDKLRVKIVEVFRRERQGGD